MERKQRGEGIQKGVVYRTSQSQSENDKVTTLQPQTNITYIYHQVSRIRSLRKSHEILPFFYMRT